MPLCGDEANNRPIVSNIGSISHPVSKYLANIFSPLVGDTSDHVNNSADLASKIQDLIVTPGQKLLSYDVSALFTSIPVPEAIECVNSKLEAVDTWKDRTMLTLKQVVRLLLRPPTLCTGEDCTSIFG